MTESFTISLTKPFHKTEIQEITEEFEISEEYHTAVKTILVALELQTERKQ